MDLGSVRGLVEIGSSGLPLFCDKLPISLLCPLLRNGTERRLGISLEVLSRVFGIDDRSQATARHWVSSP